MSKDKAAFVAGERVRYFDTIHASDGLVKAVIDTPHGPLYDVLWDDGEHDPSADASVLRKIEHA